MINKSRSNLAYNLIDIDGSVDETTREKLTAINGVLKVRFID
jgi:hypothetical protein